MNIIINIRKGFQRLGDPSYYYKLRRKKDKLVVKFCKPLLELGLNADHITLTGFLSGLCSLLFLNKSHFLFLSFWGTTRVFDIIDGSFYRHNHKTWFSKLNLDKYADIAYDTLLTLFTVQYTGVLLSLLSLVARFIHVKLSGKNWANSFLGPHSGFTHFFFIFRRFKEGVLAQTAYSISVPVFRQLLMRGKRIFNKNEYSN